MDGRTFLSDQDAKEIVEIIDSIVDGSQDTLLFADAYLRSVDSHYCKLSNEYLSGTSNNPVIYNDPVFGLVVCKHSDYPRIIERARRNDLCPMRSRRTYWSVHYASNLLHFHVIPNQWREEEVQVSYLLDPLYTEWLREEPFRIGISQMAIDPEYTITGSSYKGVKFRISYSKTDLSALYEEFLQTLSEAFARKVSLALFPELCFPAELEANLLEDLKALSYEYGHSLALIIGYLHMPFETKECANVAKLMIPSLDEETEEIKYGVLCCSIKKEPVTFEKNERGLENISLDALKYGAIEDIDLGETWNIVETPIGRMDFVICKDFITMPEDFIKEMEIDLLLVSAMTPKMIGKFMDRAKDIRNRMLATIAIAEALLICDCTFIA
ncbi:hypothetical protein BSNK01_17850 [Bacillaceae bacterium]